MAEALQKDTKESITVAGTTYLRRVGLEAKAMPQSPYLYENRKKNIIKA
jgi:hypothetical protein